MRKKAVNFSVSPWAALFAGLMVYFADGKTLLLLVMPVLAHEFGHLFCLWLLGCRICDLQWELCGLCIRYSGDPGRWGHAAAALAGPIAGLVYAWFAAKLGPDGEISAGVSLLLSLFNLIPALPLDGGRAAQALIGGRRVKGLSITAAIFTAVCGLLQFLHKKGAGLLIAGVYLLLAQFRQGISSASSPD